MSKLKIRFITVIIVQVITIMAIFFIESRTQLAYSNFKDPHSVLPIEFGNWKGVDYELDESVYDILETPFIIHRNYSNQNSDVLLSVVSYPNAKVDFHKPESCLGGKGIEIKKSFTSISLNYDKNNFSIPIVELTRQSISNNMLVFYFFKTDDIVENSLLEARLQIIKNRLIKGSTSNMLVRVSTTIKNDNYKQASKTLRQFLNDLYPSLDTYH